MRFREICESADPSAQKLLALSQFLSGRADDENARKEISTDAFIQAAKSLGIEVNPQNLGEYIAQEPLKDILEPLDPNSGVIRFRGNTEGDTGMPVDQARAIVDKNAKAALNRRTWTKTVVNNQLMCYNKQRSIEWHILKRYLNIMKIRLM